MRGLVIKSTGSSYIVRMDDGTSAECRIKGNFRIRGIRSTNPVAVGDFVQVEDGWITSELYHPAIDQSEQRESYPRCQHRPGGAHRDRQPPCHFHHFH